MTDNDRVKTYWDNRPCNIKHSDKQLLTKEYFDEVEQKKYYVEPHIVSFSEFSIWKGKKVLELGCGIGTTSISFAREGANIDLVDISDKSLDICKERVKLFNVDAQFYNGAIDQLSSFLPAQTYDLIYSFGVIHHSSSPEKCLKEIYKY